MPLQIAPPREGCLRPACKNHSRAAGIGKADPAGIGYIASDGGGGRMKTQNQIWPIVRVQQAIVDIEGGVTQRPTIENVGTPQLRTNNVSPQGNIDLTDVINVSVSPAEFQKYAVRKGDVIFNNTNSVEWVGKTAYFDIDGEYVLSNHMTRIRVNGSMRDPEFLARCLHYLLQPRQSGSIADQ